MTMTLRPKNSATKLFIAALISASLSAPSYGEIFRTVDADGNVTFSDQAPPSRGGRVTAEKVEITTPNTFADQTPYQQFDNQSLGSTGDDESENSDEPKYSVSIASPSNDQTIRENSGNVIVRARVTPELAKGNQLRLLLDGSLYGGPVQGGSISLPNVPRGTHKVRVVVENEKGRRIAESAESVFHLQRISLLSPARAGGGN